MCFIIMRLNSIYMYIISVLGHITDRKPLSVEDLSFYGTLKHKVSINEESTHTCTYINPYRGN